MFVPCGIALRKTSPPSPYLAMFGVVSRTLWERRLPPDSLGRPAAAAHVDLRFQEQIVVRLPSSVALS